MVNIFLLIFLLLILIFIAIFSININIVISFFASTEHENVYDYKIKIAYFTKKRTAAKKNNGPISNKIKKDTINHLHLYKKHIYFDDISVIGLVSLEKANLSALACGLLYSLSGFLCGLLYSHSSGIKINKIDIKPIYNEKIYAEILFECILKFNLGNIIFERIKIIRSNKNVKSDK